MEFMESKIKLIKGKSMEIYDKILYPVIQISIQKNIKGEISGADIIPIAIIVEEGTESYILSLSHEEMDLDETLEKLSIYKIKMSF